MIPTPSDIGLGNLSGGVRFIKYLSAGHYYGVEKEQALEEVAYEVELPRHG